ncbi:MAG: three-helix bundle dimerization domain-containing protein, partial [Marmoricola sp.]
MNESSEQQFERIVEDLTREYGGAVGADAVLRAVQKYRTELEPAARITDYIPVLVRRFAREELELAVR